MAEEGVKRVLSHDLPWTRPMPSSFRSAAIRAHKALQPPVCELCKTPGSRVSMGEWETKDGWRIGWICPRCFNDDSKKKI